MEASPLPLMLGLATLLPLAAFFIVLLAGPYLGKGFGHGGWVSTGAIVGAGLLSLGSLIIWLSHDDKQGADHAAGAKAHHDADHPPGKHTEGEHAKDEHGPGGDHPGHDENADHDDNEHGHHHAVAPPRYISRDYYRLGKFGDLELTISCYIDALTVVMFCMVTLIASCIHFYSMGYMHEELHEVTDHEVTLSDGSHLHRPGRYYRFFQYLSLFCFSMLGLVLAGNIAMVFVFWELVGICSYFLIGFYVERHSASTAANKAFIVNRVGDFGMIIGLMILWTGLGTFAFGDKQDDHGEAIRNEAGEIAHPGLFSLVRSEENDYQLKTPDGMVLLAAREPVNELVQQLVSQEGAGVSQQRIEAEIEKNITPWRDGEGPSGRRYGYGLLIIAGLGIFCGCVGKSAQFPLHVWLPDAMEGPTPVSALVHSATMVAAGVYLVGRFYPVFAPEVLLTIAIIGCITLFMAATIAITATDIKRVLAYSTVSQLGYMMFALGLGGWAAGLLHLITHAFFKSLLFLCSGSVIHAVHTNEMTEMGGLRKKMPVTAYTMLVGCLAIAGISIPFLVGFSGYYSKDAILEQAYSFMGRNQTFLGGALFTVAAGGAAITAFYMFRMWYMTFAGQPRNEHRYEHAHESPKVMYVPLIILAVFATGVAWRPQQGLLVAAGIGVVGVFFALRYLLRDRWQARALRLQTRQLFGALLVVAVALAAVSAGWSQVGVVLVDLLEQARPAGTASDTAGVLVNQVWPDEHFAHQDAQFWSIVFPVTMLATGTALGGILLATAMYCLGILSPAEVRRQFEAIYRFLLNKWWFDELYGWMFVRPTRAIAGMASRFDRNWIDWVVDGSANLTRRIATVWDLIADRTIVDGSVNLVAAWTYAVGVSLRQVQTGRLRQYVMFIIVGAIAIFILVSFFWTPTLAQ